MARLFLLLSLYLSPSTLFFHIALSSSRFPLLLPANAYRYRWICFDSLSFPPSPYHLSGIFISDFSRVTCWSIYTVHPIHVASCFPSISSSTDFLTNIGNDTRWYRRNTSGTGIWENCEKQGNRLSCKSEILHVALASTCTCISVQRQRWFTRVRGR